MHRNVEQSWPSRPRLVLIPSSLKNRAKIGVAIGIITKIVLTRMSNLTLVISIVANLDMTVKSCVQIEQKH